MKPSISITIMVRDSGPILDEFLTRITDQNINQTWELVVLYFGQGNETLNKFKKYPHKIVRIDSKEFDFGASRDLVCSHASGKYIVTMSVDALPANRDWLKELISPMVYRKVDIVQGGIECPEIGDKNYPDFFFWEKNYGFYYSSEGNSFNNKYGRLGLSCINLGFRKSVWEKTGFSGVSYCEDKIFQERAFKAGFVILFSEKARVIHAHSYKNVKNLFQRIANEGLGWKELGENYGISLLLKDLLRFDMHWLAIKAFFTDKLKFNSEIWFFFIRPIAICWGNKFLKTVYK